ncbi:MAG: O-antigen ligase family protein [Candidatus Komeilibacteria bacterium]|nr:O-antigen ligase family protein [Candidatus Komeilibacteria bacterium]
MSKLKKITEYLFYLWCFLIPWQARYIIDLVSREGSAWEYGSEFLYGTEIILGGILLGLIISRWESLKDLKVSRLVQEPIPLLLLGLLIWSALTLLWADDIGIASAQWLWLLEAVVVIFIVSSHLVHKSKIATAVIFSGIVQSGLAIYQWLTQEVLASAWLGMSSQEVFTGGVSVVENAGRWLRAYGSLPHPNILGGFLVIVFWLLAWWIKNEISDQINVKKWHLWFAWGGLVLVTSGIILSFSRAAWVALVISLAASIIIKYGRKYLFSLNWRQALNPSWLLKIAAVVLIVGVFWSTQVGDLMVGRWQADSRLEVYSLQGRAAGITAASDIIRRHWVTGSGLGNYTTQLPAGYPGYAYQPVHNTPLLIWSELGLPGILLALSLFLYLLLPLFRQQRYELLGLWIALIIIINFDHFWWSLYPGLMFSGLAIGWLRKGTQN